MRRGLLAAGALLVAASISTGAAAQQSCPVWEAVSSTTTPTPTRSPALAFDSARGVVVRVGGASTPTEAWEWNGVDWTRVADAPAPVTGPLAAYQASRGRTVALGSNVTLEWDGTSWFSTTFPGVAGPPADSPLVVISSPNFILGYGTDGNTRFWDGTRWTSALGGGPGPRTGSPVVYDERSGRVLLASGTCGGVVCNDVWAYNFGWSLARQRVAFVNQGRAVYSRGLGRSLIVGSDTFPTGIADSRMLRFYLPGDTMEHVSPPVLAEVTPRRQEFGLVYDAARGETLLHGGKDVASGNDLADTWRLREERAPIEMAPASGCVEPGEAVTFTARFEPFAYGIEWTKNGVAIPGATAASYTITAAAPGDAGAYAARAGQNCGPTRSPARTLQVGSCSPPDTDGDGVPDATDNCPFEPNPTQQDRGGRGSGSPPDTIGDACQCGDVNGDGAITLGDALVLQRSLLLPPTAVLAQPRLCDVGGGAGCSLTDAILLRRALLQPPAAQITQSCDPATP